MEHHVTILSNRIDMDLVILDTKISGMPDGELLKNNDESGGLISLDVTIIDVTIITAVTGGGR
jgi:hypothetical protein